MNEVRRGLFQMRLSTALLLMVEASLLLLVFVRGSPWVPDGKAVAATEFKRRFPDFTPSAQSPDGKRRLYDTEIYDNSPARPNLLFSFPLRDHASEAELLFGLVSDKTPMHTPIGFLDDDHCVLVFSSLQDGVKTSRVRVWRRCYPEWWWGCFYRLEVWVAGLLGLVLLRIAWRYAYRPCCNTCRAGLNKGGIATKDGRRLCPECERREAEFNAKVGGSYAPCPWCHKQFPLFPNHESTGCGVCPHCRSYVYFVRRDTELFVERTPTQSPVLDDLRGAKFAKVWWAILTLVPSAAVIICYWYAAPGACRHDFEELVFGNLLGWGFGSALAIEWYRSWKSRRAASKVPVDRAR